MNDILIYFSHMFNGNNKEIYRSLKSRKSIDENKLLEIKENLIKEGIIPITIFDEKYPKALKELRYSPFVLYCKGNTDLLNKDVICLTGEYSDDKALINMRNFSNDLSKKTVLLTNNYKNMDEEIIDIYKNNQGGIIYLLPHGIKYNEIKIDEKNELLLTQYPLDRHPTLFYFKERNVLLAALAKYLIVFSSKKNSGIINLAMNFANLNKEVYCFPSNVYDDGNTFLLKSGANLMTHIGDVNYY
ncbi:DNA-processing protein DprA [Mycoplasmopsis felifaucium]|uniref:DNA-processing protein DprA n=1 Tax=Mycoplasmopsis felifaucium TaxID=35768 RepID=A0ABZ2RS40_9BACT